MPENKPKLTDPKLDELCEKAARLGYRTAVIDVTDMLFEYATNVRPPWTTEDIKMLFQGVNGLLPVKKRLT